MFSNLLFIMSLEGSIVFILYIFTYPVTNRYFSLKQRYGILKTALAFYLLPVPVCKYPIIEGIRFFFPEAWKNAGYLPDIVDMEYIIIKGSDFIEISSDVRRMLLTGFFIGTVSLVIMQRRMIQYWKWKTVCGTASEKPADWELELFRKVKKETGIKKDVKLIYSEYCKSPMASGAVSSVLLFPVWRNEMRADDYEYMFRHELIHIKHNDLLIKYTGLLVMAVHWYNPLVYALFRELSVISEMYCDSIVIRGKGENERRKYSDLILTLAAKNEYAGKEKFFAGMAGSRNKNAYKRRILEMKTYKKQKTVLAFIMTVLIVMSGGMTALAYNPPNTISGPIEQNPGAKFWLVSEPAEAEQKLPSDYFFMDGTGNIYDISSSDKNSRIVCVHDFSRRGTLNEHKKDGKGGCVIKSYDALICFRCSDVKIIGLKSTVTYKPCPH